ncbi:MAG: PorT family protein [Flavobacteriales bacterium]|nr:PorT family protein [Flavobacteriales bacterium]
MVRDLPYSRHTKNPNDMRHFVLGLTAALGIVSHVASAQEILISGGLNGSNVQQRGEEGWVGRSGYQGGVDLKLGKRFFVQPGLHFLVRNLNYTYATAADIPAQEYRYTAWALRVPVMAGFRLVNPEDEPLVNMSVMVGPSALINMNADLDQDQLTVKTNPAQWYLGGAVEGSVSFVFIRAGYDFAMSNVFEGDRFSTNPKVNFYHVSAGVRLRLAR